MRFFCYIMLFLLLYSCDTEPQTTQNTPNDAAKGLFSALKAEDFDQATLYLTESSIKSLNLFATNLKMVNEQQKADLLDPYNMELSKVDCSEDQGTTTCKLCCGNYDDVIIELVQQDSKWFVQMEFPF